MVHAPPDDNAQPPTPEPASVAAMLRDTVWRAGETAEQVEAAIAADLQTLRA